jgi:hypothetical protein
VLLLAACQSSDTFSGVTSIIRVQGGQAIRGSISDPENSGSFQGSARVVPTNARVLPGLSDQPISGSVGGSANAVALGVAGDVAYWRVPALDPDPTNPEVFNFTAALSIARNVMDSSLLQADSDGSLSLPLTARAVDNAGNFGPPYDLPLLLGTVVPSGSLIVSLQWDSATDLDLHVLIPAQNVEVWAKSRSADKTTPDGNLDFDSNANCQIDGRDQENVIWQGVAPPGHYVVRVAAASLCGLTSAAWYAFATSDGGVRISASGVLTEAATRSGAAKGSGVTAFEFDYQP